MNAILHYGHKPTYNSSHLLTKLVMIFSFCIGLSTVGVGQSFNSDPQIKTVAGGIPVTPVEFNFTAADFFNPPTVECYGNFFVQMNAKINDSDELTISVQDDSGNAISFNGNNCTRPTGPAWTNLDFSAALGSCIDLATESIKVTITKSGTNVCTGNEMIFGQLLEPNDIAIRLRFTGVNVAESPVFDVSMPTELTVDAGTACSIDSADVITQIQAMGMYETWLTDNCQDDLSDHTDITLSIMESGASYDLTCGTTAHGITLVASDGCDLSADTPFSLMLNVEEDDAPTSSFFDTPDNQGSTATNRVTIPFAPDACEMSVSDVLDSIFSLTTLAFTEPCPIVDTVVTTVTPVTGANGSYDMTTEMLSLTDNSSCSGDFRIAVTVTDLCGNPHMRNVHITLSDESAPTITIAPASGTDTIVIENVCSVDMNNINSLIGAQITATDGCAGSAVPIDANDQSIAFFAKQIGLTKANESGITFHTDDDLCEVLKTTFLVETESQPVGASTESIIAVTSPTYSGEGKWFEYLTTVCLTQEASAKPQQKALTAITPCETDLPKLIYISATDECGKVAMDSVYIDVIDTVLPSVTPPANDTISIDITAGCSIESSAIVAYVNTNIIPMDNCANPPTVWIDGDFDENGKLLAPACPNNTVLVDIHVVDACGNDSTLTDIVIEMNDVTKPTFTIETGVKPLYLGADSCAMSKEEIIAQVKENYISTLSDNCTDVEDIEISVVTDGPFSLSADCSTGYADIQMQLRATDLCGTFQNRNPIFRLYDTIAPVMTVPNEMTFYTSSSEALPGSNANGCRVSKAEFLTALQADPAYTLFDNCTDSAMIVVTADFGTAGNNLNTTCSKEDISYTVSVTATDACGANATTESITLKVIDDTAPVAGTHNIPDFTAVDTCDVSAASMLAALSVSGVLSYTDDCTTPISVELGPDEPADYLVSSCAKDTTHEVALVVTDHCGNILLDTVSVKLSKSYTGPVVTIALEYISDATADAVVNGGDPAASDNDDPNSPDNDYGSTGTNQAIIPVPLDEEMCEVTEAELVAEVTAALDISDNCSGGYMTEGGLYLNRDIAGTSNDIDLADYMMCGGQVDVEIVVTDDCGLVTALVVTAEFVDETAPTIDAPTTANLTLSAHDTDGDCILSFDELIDGLLDVGMSVDGICGDTTWYVTLDDPATNDDENGMPIDGENPSIISGNDAYYDGDATPIVDNRLTASCVDQELTIYLWAGEMCEGAEVLGNVDTVVVSFIDDVAPVFTYANGDIVMDTVELAVVNDLNSMADEEHCYFAKQIKVFNANSIDDCQASPVISYTSDRGTALPLTPTANGYQVAANWPVGETAVTVTVTDACGLMSDSTFYVVVEDQKAPTITPAALPTSTVYVPRAADCSVDSLVVLDSILSQLDIAFDDACGVVDTFLSSVPAYDGTYGCDNGPKSMTVTVVDAAGNASTIDVDVILDDVTPPTIAASPYTSEATALDWPGCGVDFSELRDYVAASDACSSGGVVITFSDYYITTAAKHIGAQKNGPNDPIHFYMDDDVCVLLSAQLGYQQPELDFSPLGSENVVQAWGGFVIGDGDNDEVETFFTTICPAEYYEEPNGVKPNIEKSAYYDIEACDVDGPQPVYVYVEDQCGNGAVDSFYIDVHESTGPSISLTDPAVIFEYSSSTCMVDSATLLSAIKTDINGTSPTINPMTTAYCDWEYSLDESGPFYADCAQSTQTVNLRVTECDGQTASVSLTIRVIESNPNPIITVGGTDYTGGDPAGEDLNDPIDGDNEHNGNLTVALDPMSCDIDEATLVSAIVSEYLTLSDNCDAAAPTVDMTASGLYLNKDIDPNNDIVLADIVDCGAEVQVQIVVTDACGYVSVVTVTAELIDETAPEIDAPATEVILTQSAHDTDMDCTLSQDELIAGLKASGMTVMGVCGDETWYVTLDDPATFFDENGDPTTPENPAEISGNDAYYDGGVNPIIDNRLTASCDAQSLTVYLWVSEDCEGAETTSNVDTVVVSFIDDVAPSFSYPGSSDIVADSVKLDNSTDAEGKCFVMKDIKVFGNNSIVDCNEDSYSYTTDDPSIDLSAFDGQKTITGIAWPVGYTEVTVTVTDLCGLSTDSTFVVAVEDKVAPTVTLSGKGDATDNRLGVQIDGICSIDSLSLLDSIMASGSLTFADSCGLADTSIVTIGEVYTIDDDGMCMFSKRIFDVTIRVTDVHDNYTNKEFYVRLDDSIAPTLTLPDMMTFTTSFLEGCGLDSMSFADSLLTHPDFTVSDNCTDGAYIIDNNLTITGFPAATDNPNTLLASCTDMYKIYVTVEDACGKNQTIDSLMVEIVDDIKPEWDFGSVISSATAPDTLEYTTDTDTCIAEKMITLLDSDPTDCTDISYSYAVDNGAEILDTLMEGKQLEFAFMTGTTHVTLTVTDGCANDSSATFVVIVKDEQKPETVVDCVTEIDVDNDLGMCGATIEVTYPTYDDPCGMDTLIAYHIIMDVPRDTFRIDTLTGADAMGGQVVYEFYPVGESRVRFRAQDINGNTKTCKTDITVEDTELPVFVCPDPATVSVYLDSMGLGLLNADALLANGASDNCGLADPMLIQFGSTTAQTEFTCDDVGDFFAMNIIVKDIHGKVAPSCDVFIEIVDTIAPVITLNGIDGSDEMTTLSCGESYVETADILFDNTENCSNVVINISGDVDTNVPDTYVLTYNAIDESGNAAATVTRTVVVVDGLPEDPIVIAGDAAICPENVYIYSFASFDGLDDLSINWSYTGAGATFVGGQGTNTVMISFGATASVGDLIVNLSNGSCVDEDIILAVTLESPAVCGSAEDCVEILDVAAIDAIIDDYYATDLITSDALIEMGRDVLFQAANSIELNEDFEVELGAVFEAQIGPCLVPTEFIDRAQIEVEKR